MKWKKDDDEQEFEHNADSFFIINPEELILPSMNSTPTTISDDQINGRLDYYKERLSPSSTQTLSSTECAQLHSILDRVQQKLYPPSLSDKLFKTPDGLWLIIGALFVLAVLFFGISRHWPYQFEVSVSGQPYQHYSQQGESRECAKLKLHESLWKKHQLYLWEDIQFKSTQEAQPASQITNY